MAPISLLLGARQQADHIRARGSREHSQELSKSGRQSNEGGTGVQDDTGVLKFSHIVTESNSIEIDLPVRLATQRDLDEITTVVALINTTEGDLGAIAFLVGVSQIESKNALVKEILVQQVVEGRDDLVDGDGVETQSQDAVEATEGKSKAGLAGRLGEQLILDLQITDLDGVLRDVSTQTARSVSDLELAAVLLVRGRRG